MANTTVYKVYRCKDLYKWQADFGRFCYSSGLEQHASKMYWAFLRLAFHEHFLTLQESYNFPQNQMRKTGQPERTVCFYSNNKAWYSMGYSPSQMAEQKLCCVACWDVPSGCCIGSFRIVRNNVVNNLFNNYTPSAVVSGFLLFYATRNLLLTEIQCY